MCQSGALAQDSEAGSSKFGPVSIRAPASENVLTKRLFRACLEPTSPKFELKLISVFNVIGCVMSKELLSDLKIKKKMIAGVRRLSDGGGLYLKQFGTSTKVWYQDVNVKGARRSYSLGAYPDVGLAEARKRSADLRYAVANGLDPSIRRKNLKGDDKLRPEPGADIIAEAEHGKTFGQLAKEWYFNKKPGWSPSHAEKVLYRLEKYLQPELGDKRVVLIKRKDISALLRKIGEETSYATVDKVRQIAYGVFDVANSDGEVDGNPCPKLTNIVRAHVVKHRAAFTDPTSLMPLLQAIENYAGSIFVKTALQLLPEVFLRSGELRPAKWEEIDFEKRQWLVPASRMKSSIQKKATAGEHIVPLSTRAIELLQVLQRFSGGQKYIFRGQGKRNPYLSDAALCKAIRRMGFDTKTEQSIHGFRATARTLIVERLGWLEPVVELQLAHVVKDSNGYAYNRTALLSARKNMIEEWAGYLSELRRGVVPQDREYGSRQMPVIDFSAILPFFTVK